MAIGRALKQSVKRLTDWRRKTDALCSTESQHSDQSSNKSWRSTEKYVERSMTPIGFSNSKVKPFKYLPLPKPSSIRLLKIHPGEADPIQCSLVNSDLQEDKPYDSLSYVWGNPFGKGTEPENLDLNSSSLISVNNQPFRVTANLFDAILQLRARKNASGLWNEHDSADSELIWIDAICIDQSNLVERNAQVTIMGKIYKKASKVIVWLGRADPDPSDTETAIDLLSNLASIPPVDLKSIHRSMIYHSHFYELQGLKMPSKKAWICLSKFFHRRWFRRIWIKQEIILAQEILVLCGEWLISWKHIVAVSRFLADTQWNRTLVEIMKGKGVNMCAREDQHSGSSFPEHHWARTPAQMDLLRESVQNGVALYSDAILQDFRGAEASDPRDVIYGILGILQDTKVTKCGIEWIMPDYNVEIKDLFLEVARRMVEHSKNLTLLHYLGPSPENRMPGLPSWIPDWTLPSGFSVSRTSPWRKVCHARNLSIFGNILSMEGVFLDTIGEAECLNNRDLDGGLASKLQLHYNLPEKCPLTFQHRSEVLWRGILVEKIKFEKPTEAEVPLVFRAWLARVYASILNGMSTAKGERKVQLTEHMNQLDVMLDNISKEDHNSLIPDVSTLKSIAEIFEDPKHPQHGTMSKRAAMCPSTLSRTSARRLFLTHSKCLGTGSKMLQIGDTIWLFPGAAIPLVLRPLENGRYRLMGEAYVHGYNLVNYYWPKESNRYEVVEIE
ncbi:hypothetical protein AOQ84DRAFT_376930 [Glonium stellatum]|uniref:Heterokaryon incompatibility domain-containing protein n=1 Tax=Glonium stellatum TaxID=574774 RepID=A0A8E2JSV6_9PEZI|nr:hypothetical protein AOQ84DRAFT_376930 [Glonium stellatum]